MLHNTLRLLIVVGSLTSAFTACFATSAQAGTCTTGTANSGKPPKTDSDGWAMVNVCATTGGGGGSGSVTQGTSPWVDNIAQFGGVTVSLGQKTMAASMPVTFASDQSILGISAASLPLPAGASTSVLQMSGNTSLSTIATNTTGLATSALQSVIQGVIGPATAPTTMALAGGVFQTPTLTSGQSAALTLNSIGSLVIADAFLDSTVVTIAAPIAAPSRGVVQVGKYVAAGVAVGDGQVVASQVTSTGAQQVTEQPSALAIVALPPSVTATASASLQAKSGAGNLYGFCGAAASAAGWIEVLDTMTVPTGGATITPKQVIAISGATGSNCLGPNLVPESYTTGILVLVNTNASPFTYTAGTAFLHANVK